MAQVEPMDIDAIESDFDNKENTFHHSNVLSRTPCTEKGYEELDVSELNMKLRYSITPASSPMSKSFTGPCLDNRSYDPGDENSNPSLGIDTGNLTRSLNSTLTKTECKSSKSLPLQALAADQFVDTNRNTARRSLDPLASEDKNVTITVDGSNEIDENLSLPSTSSSATHTPEATTPTKDIPKPDGSPIMRGLKSVLNMFRSSQSPIPINDDKLPHAAISPLEPHKTETEQLVLASTPVAPHRNKDANSSRRSSPLKDSVVFNDDLERELQWKDETTIIFKEEKIPVHKLFFQNPLTSEDLLRKPTAAVEHLNSTSQGFLQNPTAAVVHLNSTVEYMDISCNESGFADKTVTDIETNTHSNINNVAVESDNEFLDCETTFTKNESHASDYRDSEIENKVENINNLIMDFKEDGQLSEVHKEEITDVLNKSENIMPPDLCVESLVTEQVSVSVAEQHAVTTGIIEATKYLLNNERTNDLNVDDVQSKISPINVEDIKNESQLLNQLDVDIQENLNITKTIEDNKDITATEKSMLDDIANIKVNCKMDMQKCAENSSENISNVICEKEQINLEFAKSLDANGNPDVNPQSPYKEVICKIGNFNDMFSQRTNDSSVYSVVPGVLQNITVDKEVVCDTTPFSVRNSNHNVEELNITSENSSHDDKNILEKNLESLLAEIKEEANQSASTAIVLDKEVNKNENLNVTSNLEYDGLIHCDTNTISTITSLMEEQGSIITNTVENYGNLSSTVSAKSENNFISSESVDMTNHSTDIISNDNTHNIGRIAEANNDHMVIAHTCNSIETLKDDVAKVTEMPPSISDNTMELIDNDRECPELTIQNDTTFSELPSEVPLPDEDDIEREILESDVVFEISENAQDVTMSIMKENSTMIVENTDGLQIQNPVSDSKLLNVTSVVNDPLVHPMDVPQTDINNDHDEAVKTDNIILDSSAVDVVPKSVEVIDNLNVEIVESRIMMENISTLHNSICQEDMEKINNVTLPVDDSFPVEPVNSVIAVPNEEQKSVQDEIVLNKEELDKIPVPKENVDTEMTEVKWVENFSDNLKTTIDIYVNTDKVDNGIDKTCSVSPDNEKLNNNFSIVQIATSGDDKMNIDQVPSNEKIDGVRTDLTKAIDEIDEEIITSANNSPYVSVLDLGLDIETKTNDSLEEAVDPLGTKSVIAPSPPLSPKIISKGTYNFNFDDMEDPFATKTKIRSSPTPDSLGNQTSTAILDSNKKLDNSKKINNKRKSQPERKRPLQKKNLNSTFSGSVNVKGNVQKNADMDQKEKNNKKIVSIQKSADETKNKSEEPKAVVSELANIPNTPDPEPVTESSSVTVPQNEETAIHQEIKPPGLTGTSIEKSTSSSEQYFSLGTSGESVEPMHKSKNVFNLPEIDDINFNPFATKSKMRLSPATSLENLNKTINDTTINKTLNSSITVTKENEINNATITMEVDSGNETFNKVVTKDTSPNISIATSSSKNTDDRNITVREILTEDEDTIEGPFFEAEDLKDIEKISDMNDENDMMRFNDLPPQEKDQNLENGELFIDADAFEFLLNQNKSNTVLDSGKESLFLKFDPLFAKRVSSDGVLAALQKVQKRQSTPKKLIKPTQKDSTHIEKPVAGPSVDKINNIPFEDYIQEDQSSTTTKPMMVVNPAVSSMVSPRKSTTPPKLNRRSLTFTSPAMAVIDRLLSLSGNTSLLNHDTSMPHAGREHNETDLVITQLRELLAEKEIHVHNLRSESKELKDRLATLEVQVKTLETEGKDRLSKINELNERLTEKTKINKSMATVVEEYERTIASLIAETEQDKKRNAEERMRLIKERDEQTAHLASMEVSFSDLHSKYEKSKQIILSCKANEDTYKKSIKEFEDNFLKMQNNYELLKQHATSKLNHANQELEKMNRGHDAEVLKLNAMIKRKELHITSLEETLTQKTKANEELTAICDELINKVG